MPQNRTLKSGAKISGIRAPTASRSWSGVGFIIESWESGEIASAKLFALDLALALQAKRAIMCGRFTLHHSADEVAQRFNVQETLFEFPARYNIAPMQPLAVITHNALWR